jgi:hypothetical protein
MTRSTLLRIFSQAGIFAGFSLHISNFAGRVSEAAMSGARDIIIHSLGGPLEGEMSLPRVLAWGFLYSRYHPRICEAAMSGAGDEKNTSISYSCTYDLFGPMHNVFDAGRSIVRASWRGLGLGNQDFGPCEIASSR